MPFYQDLLIQRRSLGRSLYALISISSPQFSDSSTLIIDGFHNLGRFFSRAINPFLSVVNVLQAGVVYEGFKDLEMGEDIILDDEDEEDDSQCAYPSLYFISSDVF